MSSNPDDTCKKTAAQAPPKPEVRFASTLLLDGEELRGSAARIAVLLCRAREDQKSYCEWTVASLLNITSATARKWLYGPLSQSGLVIADAHRDFSASDTLMSAWVAANRPRQDGLPGGGMACVACGETHLQHFSYCPDCGIEEKFQDRA